MDDVGGLFMPQNPITRAECAKMITTIMNGIADGKIQLISRE